MKILVKAKASAKANKVIPPERRLIPQEEEWWRVEIKEKPVEGRANDAIAELLAKHFGVARTAVRLTRGATSRKKVFEIK